MINTMFMDKMAPGILRLSVMDNDIDLFEGQYPVPDGVSYNSYLIEDEQLCLLDTVDAPFATVRCGQSEHCTVRIEDMADHGFAPGTLSLEDCVARTEEGHG